MLVIQSKKTDYDAKILDIDCKYFTAADLNKLTSQKLDAKIKQKELVSKSDISDLVQNADLDYEIATLASKVELKTAQDKITQLQACDSSYFLGKSYFEDDDTQN